MTGAEGTGRVVVVTGGGNGIGAAIATELGRLGDHVVTLDPLVSVDGTDALPEPGQTTAGAIVAAGGSAEASSVSVTDRDAVRELFDRLVRDHGRVDGVVNVAGITRPTGFARGEETDWASVLAVHLDGYRNVLDAALGHFAAAGSGHVLGVTSGSGWRAADAGAYSAAKRAVASLTWQLGRAAPDGVTINAISPIAMTRMVAAAMGRQRRPASSATAATDRSRATGGLALGALPEPEHLAPLGAHLLGHGTRRVHGQVLFAGGSEVAVVDPPRLLEVVRTSDVRSLDTVVGRFVEVLAEAEGAQATTGGANPRFPTIFDEEDDATTAGAGRTVVVVADRPDLATTLAAGLEAAGARTVTVPATEVAVGFAAARGALDAAAGSLGAPDAVVVALTTPGTARGAGWQAVVEGHTGLADLLLRDAAWNRATADLAAASGRPLRLVTLTDATTPGGRSRAQAAAQVARAAPGATADLVGAVPVSVEQDGQERVLGALTTALALADGAAALAGAELVVGAGWLGLRSHPRPGGSIVLGGPALPEWFDEVLGEACR